MKNNLASFIFDFFFLIFTKFSQKCTEKKNICLMPIYVKNKFKLVTSNFFENAETHFIHNNYYCNKNEMTSE